MKGLWPAALIPAAVFLLAVALPDWRGDGTYYTASRLLLQGRAGPQMYDNDWMRAEIEAATRGRVSDIFRPNPPTAALLALSVAWLPPDLARRAWAGFNTAVLFATLGLCHAEGRLPEGSRNRHAEGRRPEASRASSGESMDSGARPFGGSRLRVTRVTTLVHSALLLLALAFGLFAAPVVEGFQLGQAYILLLGLYVLAWWGLRRRRNAVAGLSLALALMLKTSGAPLWLLLAARREWRTLGWAVLGCLALFGLGLPWLGLGLWRAYVLDVLPAAAASPSVAVTAFQSLGGFSAHLFRADAVWNPSPLADLPALASGLSALALVAVLAATLVTARRAPLDLGFGAMAAASVFLVPYAEQHHYTLMALPLLLAAMEEAPDFRSLRDFGSLAALILAALLMGLPLPYESPRLASGAWALLAYPRLYGGLLLWGWFLIRAALPGGRLAETARVAADG